MNSKVRTCSTHRRFETKEAAWEWARYTERNLKGDYRAWGCGNHWHVGKTRQSIWDTFKAIERERRPGEHAAQPTEGG